MDKCGMIVDISKIHATILKSKVGEIDYLCVSYVKESCFNDMKS